MLYSIGKDSAVMLRLAQKAFHPGRLPFPLLHVDTTWKFREMIEFRDQFCREQGLDLKVWINPEGRAQDINPFDHGSKKYTDVMKTEALKQALEPLPVRRGVRRRPPRRGEVAGPRSASTASATACTSGTRRTSGRSSGTSTTAR